MGSFCAARVAKPHCAPPALTPESRVASEALKLGFLLLRIGPGGNYPAVEVCGLRRTKRFLLHQAATNLLDSLADGISDTMCAEISRIVACRQSLGEKKNN